MTYKTDQEAFWAGDFGTDYINRNHGDALLASNLDFFGKALRQARGVKNCIEFGANIGMNLKALNLLYSGIHARAIEINVDAAKLLCTVIPSSNVYNSSVLDFAPDCVTSQRRSRTAILNCNWWTRASPSPIAATPIFRRTTSPCS